jgi:hypothetical protein
LLAVHKREEFFCTVITLDEERGDVGVDKDHASKRRARYRPLGWRAARS